MATLIKPDYLISPHHFEDLATKESAARLSVVLDNLHDEINIDRTPAPVINPRKLIVDEPVLRTDCADGVNVYFWVRAQGNRVWGNPQKAQDTQPVILEFQQDAVGGRTLTLDTKFRLGTDVSSPAPSATALSITMYGAIYIKAYDIFVLVSKVRGYLP